LKKKRKLREKRKETLRGPKGRGEREEVSQLQWGRRGKKEGDNLLKKRC